MSEHIESYKELLKFDLNIKKLGEPKNDSPLNLSDKLGDSIANYISDDERIFAVDSKEDFIELHEKGLEIPSFEKAGPRKKIFFKPGETVSAIVSCGGLCPGINAVIRALVLMNFFRYNNKLIYGIKYGYGGFIDSYGYDVVELTPKIVEAIHKEGGSILGSSRGPQDVGKIVDKLEKLKVDVLYTIGGDGTIRGSLEIHKEIEKRKLNISVIVVPKTIDNDIAYIEKSFGTETAFSKACDAVEAAHIEAKDAYNGIGIVKLMGRYSGFIAVNTTLASGDVNYTLIPEMPFDLEGPKGFLENLKNRINNRHHAVIIAAEGAGQDLCSAVEAKFDKSGNKLLEDIGILLKDRIKEFFDKEKIPVSIKYIDPSYIIRSTAPTPNDALFCLQLAQMAVHAGMCGKTNLVIGYSNGDFIHLPLEIAVSKRQIIDPESELWLSVLEDTGQPFSFKN
jgi:6-phosphofructokinase 1